MTLTSAVKGRLVLPDGVTPGIVTIQDGRILSVVPGAVGSVAPGGVSRFDDDHLLLPGLVDLHCHGGGGAEFGEGVDSARHAAAHHLARGVTTQVASIVSGTPEAMVRGVRECAELVADGTLAGIHLEGPFLSAARCGAQNPVVLTDVDLGLVDAVLAAAADGGAPDAVVQWTYAPERDQAGTFPRRLAEVGILPAVGHTDADARTSRAAFEACAEVTPEVRGGRSIVTHLLNGMPMLHHRVPGPVASALAAACRRTAVAEVISDGQHLDVETVRFLFDALGAESVVLVTDAMAACGMGDGTYGLGGLHVQVTDGAARLADGGALAGSVAHLVDCLRVAVRDAEVAIHDAVRAAATTPAEVLGISDRVGSLEVGRDADLVVVDAAFEVVRVMRRGVWLDV